jgi:hypothetical protein
MNARPLIFGPNDDRVEPLQEHGEANDRDEQDRIHDGTAVAVPLEHGVHLNSLRRSMGSGARDRRLRVGAKKSGVVACKTTT